MVNLEFYTQQKYSSKNEQEMKTFYRQTEFGIIHHR